MIDVQELQDLIAWFERNRDRLPREAFRLTSYLVVSNPPGFYESLAAEIRLSARWPAHQLEPLAARLRLLREYCDGDGK